MRSALSRRGRGWFRGQPPHQSEPKLTPPFPPPASDARQRQALAAAAQATAGPARQRRTDHHTVLRPNPVSRRWRADLGRQTDGAGPPFLRVGLQPSPTPRSYTTSAASRYTPLRTQLQPGHGVRTPEYPGAASVRGEWTTTVPRLTRGRPFPKACSRSEASYATGTNSCTAPAPSASSSPPAPATAPGSDARSHRLGTPQRYKTPGRAMRSPRALPRSEDTRVNQRDARDAATAAHDAHTKREQ